MVHKTVCRYVHLHIVLGGILQDDITVHAVYWLLGEVYKMLQGGVYRLLERILQDVTG
jgi:hypothetical protein